jgi:RNA polymerase sigma-70 factor (ECF subfamily)
MRNPQDAEDVAQEAYLKAWRAFAGFRGEASRPWLLAIVRNTAFSWLRENRSHPTAEFQEELAVSAGGTPESLTLHKERARGVGSCIEQLPAEYREAIVLRELEELSYREIATVTGVPAGTVMSRLSRARARLAECIRKTGGLEPFGLGARP